jgi:hypothetical protein
METCKAVVQEGPRKGASCQFPASEHGYCGRHERNRIYDTGIEEGKHWCRFFFRGCSTELSTEDIAAKQLSCSTCRGKQTKKAHTCEHTGCKFKVKEPGFCKKHERDKYRKEEIEKGIKYCDIARGCFTVCAKGMSSCEPCLEKQRVIDNEKYKKRKQLSKALQTMEHTTKRVCAQCGKDFEKFTTRYGHESTNCRLCSEAQAKQDEKRKDRLRNFKCENYNNKERYFKEYVVSAAKRGFEMNLCFERFSQFIIQECSYCGNFREGEVNGIDRVDNSKGYSSENCVTACWKCNRIKHVYNQEFFLEKCKLLSTRSMANKSFFTKWKEYYSQSQYKQFIGYLQDAQKRGLPVEITREQWEQLTRSPCYLCGFQSEKGIGIDRVDNTVRSYTLLNSRPCCSPCNTMKGEIELEEFIAHCTTITARMSPQEDTTEIVDTPTERKFWKALGLYYAILSDSADSFHTMYSDVYTLNEYDELCQLIKESTKEKGVATLKTLLQTLKKRKQRLLATNPTPPTPVKDECN